MIKWIHITLTRIKIAGLSRSLELQDIGTKRKKKKKKSLQKKIFPERKKILKKSKEYEPGGF